MQERWQQLQSGKHEWKWYIHCFVHYLIIYLINNKETFAVPSLFSDLKRWNTLLPRGESQRLNLALTYYYDEAGDCWKDPHDQETKSAAWWNMMNYSHHPNTVLNTPQMVPIMWIFPSTPWFLRGCLILGVRDYKGFATLHVSCKRYAQHTDRWMQMYPRGGKPGCTCQTRGWVERCLDLGQYQWPFQTLKLEVPYHNVRPPVRAM